MAGVSHEDATADFDPLRPKLMRVAYRMLGSVADAEDTVQEAFIRWMGADSGEVREPGRSCAVRRNANALPGACSGDLA